MMKIERVSSMSPKELHELKARERRAEQESKKKNLQEWARRYEQEKEKKSSPQQTASEKPAIDEELDRSVRAAVAKEGGPKRRLINVIRTPMSEEIVKFQEKKMAGSAFTASIGEMIAAKSGSA